MNYLCLVVENWKAKDIAELAGVRARSRGARPRPDGPAGGRGGDRDRALRQHVRGARRRRPPSRLLVLKSSGGRVCARAAP
jgi:hypothetical protein